MPTLPTGPAVTTPEPTDQLLDALYPGLVAGWAQDQPYEPAPSPALWRGMVRSPLSGDPARLLLAGGDEPLGGALVELPSHDNPHVAIVDLRVHPAARRQGVGSALWRAVVDLARSEGRRTVLCMARRGSPAEAFVASRGGTPELEEVQRHQALAELDPDRVARLRDEAAGRATGYRLESWAGPTPAHLLAQVAVAILCLNDAPMGGLDYDGEVWDADRVARRDAAVVGAGLRMHTVLALSPAGEAAGYTDVAVSADGTYAWQWGTAVAPAHRGARLGLLLKAAMVQRLRACEPAIAVLSTWNADSNTHMIAVNDALGYVPVDRMREWQVRVG